jgi:type I restriction enzyme S subunit
MKKYLLHEIAKIENGGTPSTEKIEYWGGNIPWITPKDLSESHNLWVSGGERNITELGILNSNAKLIPSNSIIVSTRAPIGYIVMNRVPVCTNQGIKSVIPNNKIVEPLYLYYLLKTMVKLMTIRAGGTTFKEISTQSFRMLPVTLPELKVQREISMKLYQLDDMLNQNLLLISNLNEYSDLLFIKWFVDFNFPDINGNPYKDSNGEMVEVGGKLMPKGWKIEKIKHCIEHIKTGLNPRDNFKLGNGNIKYITVKNLTAVGTIDFSNCDLINEEACKMIHRRSDIKKGDILFASISPLGRCALIQDEPDGWEINESVFSIRVDSKVISSEYLYTFLRSSHFIRKAEHNSVGSIFNGIRTKTIENMDILIPDNNLGVTYRNLVTNIYRMQYLCQKQNIQLQEMRDLLIKKYIK